MSMNVVILMGRLTSDPELSQTPSGISVAKFSVAVERNYGKDGKKETDFINCIAWRTTGEFIHKWFSKGKPIAIHGQLQSRKYTDKNGQNRTAYEVIVSEAFFAGNVDKSEKSPDNFQIPRANQPSKVQSVAMDQFEDEYDDGDLPF